MRMQGTSNTRFCIYLNNHGQVVSVDQGAQNVTRVDMQPATAAVWIHNTLYVSILL